MAYTRLTYHRPADLPPAALDGIWAIVAKALRTSREDFERGLFKMDEVWLYERAGVIQGVGGVRLFFPTWRGRTHGVIFTGRVYLDPSVRGNSLLQRIGVRYYLQRLRANPFQPVYWMFGSGSYKSYLLLPRNFRTYWPRPNTEVPARERTLLEAVSQSLGNPLYNPQTGIMSHPELVYLDGHIGLNPADLHDPDVAFYARINPGQVHGDDVMCLCPLTPANWVSCLVRAIARATRRRPPAPAVAPVVEPEVAETAGAPGR